MLDDAKSAKTETEEAIATLQEEIAEAKEKLVTAEAQLKDDQLYLKDLTEKCEIKAKEWDQRSQMRADELAALTQALQVLSTTVAEKANTTGEGGRSLLEQSDDD